MMRLAKSSRRRTAKIRFDARWLFPIVLIVIAGMLAFSAEIWERVSPRSVSADPTTMVSNGH